MAAAVQDTDRDFFMGAEEAVEYGLVDAVVSKPHWLPRLHSEAGA